MAFGICRLTPAQFNEYSISEVNTVIAACVKEAETNRGFVDMLNARNCEIIARCAGNNDCKPADFLILKRESEVNKEPDTPEELGEKLKMFTRSMGGKVVTRG